MFRHTEVDSQPKKKPKKSGGKGSVALLIESKPLGCVFQDFADEIKADSREELRDLHLSWDVVVGSLVVLVVLCGAYSVSYSQPPWRTRHGCTVGVDRDPPVCCSHPGRMMTRAPALACVVGSSLLERHTTPRNKFGEGSIARRHSAF